MKGGNRAGHDRAECASRRVRFYRGARFRLPLILSYRNLVGKCLPQTLLYAATRLTANDNYGYALKQGIPDYTSG
ncbi:hypothetical protein [Yeguia hominis]|uniref:Uncharacterized protein n=1 Tax=Yeguia hominis TaxID=2763662 RepID=A0A926D9G0_9FIRM|nr:hypothetical protein [Yeguia hominis]MBC8533234.1 hypothetical protein [Yeguia hominis]